jgi:hypothetical protein
MRLRALLAAIFVLLVLLPSILIVLAFTWAQHGGPYWPLGATFIAFASALLPTYYLDHWLLGGIGFRSVAIFGLLSGIMAALLWPLPLVSALPAVWRYPRWRRIIVAYAAAVAVYAVLAGWRMAHSWALFFD